MGGINTAVAPDFIRGVLGVTGMNYGGMLLQRSSDFPLYATFLFAEPRAAATQTLRYTRWS